MRWEVGGPAAPPAGLAVPGALYTLHTRFGPLTRSPSSSARPDLRPGTASSPGGLRVQRREARVGLEMVPVGGDISCSPV